MQYQMALPAERWTGAHGPTTHKPRQGVSISSDDVEVALRARAGSTQTRTATTICARMLPRDVARVARPIRREAAPFEDRPRGHVASHRIQRPCRRARQDDLSSWTRLGRVSAGPAHGHGRVSWRSQPTVTCWCCSHDGETLGSVPDRPREGPPSTVDRPNVRESRDVTEEVSGDGGTRTLTVGVLSALPLPVGLRPRDALWATLGDQSTISDAPLAAVCCLETPAQLPIS